MRSLGKWGFDSSQLWSQSWVSGPLAYFLCLAAKPMGFQDLSSEKFGVGVLLSVLYEQFSLDLLYSAKSLGRAGGETRLVYCVHGQPR